MLAERGFFFLSPSFFLTVGSFKRGVPQEYAYIVKQQSSPDFSIASVFN